MWRVPHILYHNKAIICTTRKMLLIISKSFNTYINLDILFKKYLMKKEINPSSCVDNFLSCFYITGTCRSLVKYEKVEENAIWSAGQEIATISVNESPLPSFIHYGNDGTIYRYCHLVNRVTIHIIAVTKQTLG